MIDARIPLMVNPVKSELDRQNSLADLERQRQATELQRRQFEAEEQAQQKAAQREQVTLTAKLLDGVGDEATYQQRIAAARRFGIDVSGAPPSYDPAWVQEHSVIANTLLRPDGERKLSTAAQQAEELTGLPIDHPKTREVMSRLLADNVPTQAGGGVFTNNPLKGFEAAVVPNEGGAAMGQSVGGGGKTVTRRGKDKATGRNVVQYSDGSIEYEGGAGGNVSGTFQGY